MPNPTRLVLLGALLLTACADVTAPERGGAPWFRARSEHFVLVTDLPEAQVEPAVRDLEQRRAALLVAAWEGWPVPPGSIEVIELRDASEMAEFAPYLGAAGRRGTGVVTGFASAGPFGELSPVVSGEAGGESLRALQFGLSMQITLAQLRRVPLWLLAGLGRYLETARIDERRGVVIIGEPNPRPARDCRVAGRDDDEYAPAARAHGVADEGLGAGPLPVHRANGGVNQLLNRLHRGEEPRQAFAASFPGLDDEKLRAAVRDYSRAILHSGRVKGSTCVLLTCPLSADGVHHVLVRRTKRRPPSSNVPERLVL